MVWPAAWVMISPAPSVRIELLTLLPRVIVPVPLIALGPEKFRITVLPVEFRLTAPSFQFPVVPLDQVAVIAAP